MTERRVLVVDDDLDILELLSLVLTECGCLVRTAIDGRAALEVLNQGFEPRLIILDLMMPGMNGWAFREAQLGNPKIASIPVAIFTGDAVALRRSPPRGSRTAGGSLWIFRRWSARSLAFADDCGRRIVEIAALSGGASRPRWVSGHYGVPELSDEARTIGHGIRRQAHGCVRRNGARWCAMKTRNLRLGLATLRARDAHVRSTKRKVVLGGALVAAALAASHPAYACGAAYPGGPVMCEYPRRKAEGSVNDTPAAAPPIARVAASYAFTSTTIKLGDDRRVDLTRHTAFANLQLPLNRSGSLTGSQASASSLAAR